MNRWFRFHAEALDDPKVQRLDGDTFKAWVNLLCLASRNGGYLPSITDIGFALRIDENAARTVVERLLNATLIDKLNGGPNGYRYAPHGWEERQYKSDTSTERVKRFRKRSNPVTETAPDTETDTEVKEEKIMPDKSGAYAFFGQTIKLTPRHLTEWRRLFHSIADLEPELSTLDSWWQTQPEEKRENWFLATKGMLNKKHQKLMAEEKDEARAAVWDGMP